MFPIPILVMLKNAFHDPDIVNNLPQTTELLRQWDGKALPSEDVFAAFAAHLKAASKARTVALIGKRLNYEIPTLKSKVTVTARKLDKVADGAVDGSGNRRRPDSERRVHVGRGQAGGQRRHTLLLVERLGPEAGRGRRH